LCTVFLNSPPWIWKISSSFNVSDLEYGLQPEEREISMLLHDTIQTSGEHWSLEFLLIPLTDALDTMVESGHVGDLHKDDVSGNIFLVELVFESYINQGWVGVTQGVLYRKVKQDVKNKEGGGEHFSSVLTLLVSLGKQNALRGALCLPNISLLAQGSIITRWSTLLRWVAVVCAAWQGMLLRLLLHDDIAGKAYLCEWSIQVSLLIASLQVAEGVFNLMHAGGYEGSAWSQESWVS